MREKHFLSSSYRTVSATIIDFGPIISFAIGRLSSVIPSTKHFCVKKFVANLAGSRRIWHLGTSLKRFLSTNIMLIMSVISSITYPRSHLSPIFTKQSSFTLKYHNYKTGFEIKWWKLTLDHKEHQALLCSHIGLASVPNPKTRETCHVACTRWNRFSIGPFQSRESWCSRQLKVQQLLIPEISKSDKIAS